MTGRWLPSHLTRAQLDERRLRFIQLLEAQAHTTQELSEFLGGSVSTLCDWKDRLRHRGPHALQTTVSTGRPPARSGEQRDVLKSLLVEGALVHGVPDANWTTLRVREVIGRLFSLWHHRDHVRNILHQLGFSRQKPDERALE